jgi:two-component system sensor histidine kinase UhpB
VSDPLVLWEAVVLVAGLAALLIVNLVSFRQVFTPLARLPELMRKVDLLQPARRIPIYGENVEVAELTRAFNDMLDRLEAERRESARRSLEALEGERRRVAQELHDEVGQALTAIVLQLDRMSRKAPTTLREELAEAREATEYAKGRLATREALRRPNGTHARSTIKTLCYIVT